MKMKNPFQLKQHFSILFHPPSSPSYHPSISGLRALAFLWIAILHCLNFGNFILPTFEEYENFVNYNPFGIAVNSGHYAVDIFLLLSGFLMFEIIYFQVVRTGNFNIVTLLISRAWRLIPAMLFVSLLLRAENPRCPDVAEIFFHSNYVISQEGFSPAQSCLGVVWSVSLDFQCWVAVAFFMGILMKLRSNEKKWQITATDIVLFIAILSIYNLWKIFQINPEVPPSWHVGELIHPEIAASLERGLQIKLPNRDNAQKLVESLPYAYIYASFITRFTPFLYGILAGQLFYPQHDKFIPHLHKKSFLYLPLALTFVVLSMYFSSIHLKIVPPLLRTAYTAVQRQIFTAGVTFFFLLAISSGKPSTFRYSPIGKVTKAILSWYIWYPISQLSYIAYILSPTFIALVVLKLFPMTPSSISTFYLAKTFALSIIPLLLFSVPIFIFVEMPMMEVKKWIFPSRLGKEEQKTKGRIE